MNDKGPPPKKRYFAWAAPTGDVDVPYTTRRRWEGGNSAESEEDGGVRDEREIRDEANSRGGHGPGLSPSSNSPTFEDQLSPSQQGNTQAESDVACDDTSAQMQRCAPSNDAQALLNNVPHESASGTSMCDDNAASQSLNDSTSGNGSAYSIPETEALSDTGSEASLWSSSSASNPYADRVVSPADSVQSQEHGIPDSLEDDLTPPLGYSQCEPSESAEGGEPLKPYQTCQRLISGLTGHLGAACGATLTATSAEILLNYLEVAHHHKLPHSVHVHMLQAFNSAFSTSIVPDTRHLLDQLYSASCGVAYHYYCWKCTQLFTNLRQTGIQKECDHCHAVNDLTTLDNSKYFCILDLSYQLEILLSDESIANALRDPRVGSNSTVISDVYDGSVYKNFCSRVNGFENNVKYVTFTMCVDGTPLFKSSNCEIWPLFMMLNELPPYLRMKNLLLAGLWFGNEKPLYDVFFEPFVDHLKVFSSNGCLIKIGQEEVKIRGYLLGCCVDSGARGPVQGIHLHNGIYSCSWCLHPGVVEGEGSSARKFLYLRPPPEKRTHDGLVQDANRVLELKSKVNSVRALDKIHVNGVIKATPLLLAPCFGIVSGMIIDYLHNVCLGVTKQFLRLWLGLDGIDTDINKKNPPYYIGSPSDLRKLNEKIAKISPPVETRRMVRDLNSIAYFKGREFESWLLFYSLPVLKNVLPDNYLRHWSSLVYAMHLLLSTEITEQNLRTADNLLHEFVSRVEVLYKNQKNELPCKQMTFNVHLLLHLVDHVRNWGPLMCISGYAFEAGNGKIKQFIHRNKGIAKQIFRSYGQECALRIMRNRVASPRVEAFRLKISGSEQKKTEYVDEETKLCGKWTSFSGTDEQKLLLQNHGLGNVQFRSFQKLVWRHCCFSSFVPNKRRDNAWALTVTGDIVLIRFIIANALSGDVVLFVSMVHVTPILQLPFFCCSQVNVIEEGVELLRPSDLRTVCVSMNFDDDGHFISVMPNILNVF